MVPLRLQLSLWIVGKVKDTASQFWRFAPRCCLGAKSVVHFLSHFLLKRRCLFCSRLPVQGVQLILRKRWCCHLFTQDGIIPRPGQSRLDVAKILRKLVRSQKGALSVGIPRGTHDGVGDALQ